MNIIGLDLSLTRTGISVLFPLPRKDVLGWYVDTKPNCLVTAQADLHSRLSTILTHVDRAVGIATVGGEDTVAYIEALAFDGYDKDRVLAGLSFLVRHYLWREGVQYVLVPPTSLKKYATGSGRADKKQMLAAAKEHFPDETLADHNVADAMLLAAYGADREW